MKNMKGFRTFTALLLAVVMILGNALAGTYYIEDGSIEVHASETSQTVTQAEKTKEDDGPVISNRDPETSSANTVTIKADEGCTANVKVEDLNINVSKNDNTPAVQTEGGGNVNIELDGDSSIKSGYNAAGLQKENTGNLTINDADQNGKLEATGGQSAAGIGGGYEAKGENITISGGKVTANGGFEGAGIGGGYKGEGKDITISGGEVTATGGLYGAGIGGGEGGEGKDITISGGEVTATGGLYSAGIGGGDGGVGKDITISGGEVTATGSQSGAGIGGGDGGAGKDITISGGEVTATGGERAAGIGGGNDKEGSNIIISGGEVTATGGKWAAGIGGGDDSDGKDITISGGEVTATGGYDGAGIGGGDEGEGKNITISGGKVIASGGLIGAGIGGGWASEGKNISISGSAQVSAAGGAGEDSWGNGAAIGSGGSYGKAGSETAFQASDLKCGSIEYYAPGTSAGDIKDDTAKPDSDKTVDNLNVGHDYETDWTYNGTHHWHACIYDGCVEKQDKAAHNYDTFVERTKAPTCTETGTDVYKCTCGKTTEVEVTATGHTWDTEWSKNDTKHWHKCMNAGCTAVKDEAAHNYATFVERTKEPTCTETGTDVYKCTCGATTEKTVKATGHNWDTEWSKNDTKHWHKCTNAGCTAVQDEAEHNYAIFVERTKEPTCTETGTDVYQCTCGATTEVVVEATGIHTPAAAVKENEVPAEVGVAGSYDEVVYCASCGTELSRKTVATDPLPEPAKKNGEDFSALLAKKIRQAPENGTVEADAGAAGGLKKIVFEALEERPDVTVKLKTIAGDITIPAGANLMEKTGGKPSVSFEELKELLK